jgi:DNA-binding NtrC family response regulator
MDGTALILRLHEHYPLIPVVAVSGLASNARVADESASAGTTFVSKPYAATDLLLAVGNAIETAASSLSNLSDEPHE